MEKPSRNPPILAMPTPPSPGTSQSSMSNIEADSINTPDESDWGQDSKSITSSIIDYEFENGRRYHAYKAGHYPIPNDEHELDRLDLQHHVLTLLLNGELHLAPLVNPTRILDIGTGTGIWAIEMAERYQHATIIGTDLSPTQPVWVPDNVHFEIDDLESKWMYKEDSFDYIHSRYMIGSVSDWRRMARRAYKHCKPGGYFEIQELDPFISSDDGTHVRAETEIQWTTMLCEASDQYGRPVPRHFEFKAMFEEAGFVDVQEHFFKIPLNTWPKDKRLKEAGKFQLISYLEGCEALSIGLFTRVLNWQPMEVQVLLARFRAELRDRTLHTYQRAVIVGRKPVDAGIGRQMSPAHPEPSKDFPKSHVDAQGSQVPPAQGPGQDASGQRAVEPLQPQPLEPPPGPPNTGGEQPVQAPPQAFPPPPPPPYSSQHTSKQSDTEMTE
ncbi:hypothetical protein MMC09_005180 [Bachmanniomyces sp. S44760]|nr:hypothetical protein [Bachmanniomyces sp. S44760]